MHTRQPQRRQPIITRPHELFLMSRTFRSCFDPFCLLSLLAVPAQARLLSPAQPINPHTRRHHTASDRISTSATETNTTLTILGGEQLPHFRKEPNEGIHWRFRQSSDRVGSGSPPPPPPPPDRRKHRPCDGSVDIGEVPKQVESRT